MEILKSHMWIVIWVLMLNFAFVAIVLFFSDFANFSHAVYICSHQIEICTQNVRPLIIIH